jgi:glycerophosphoryl diester phosphodiesterase
VTRYLDAPLPLAFAHRGGAAAGDAESPAENTMHAFARAVALGFRYLETDVQATADGVPVVFHDDDLARLADRRQRIGALRWADLRTVRVAGAAAIPRLDEVLAAWPAARFNIDVKADAAVTPTIEVVRRTAALDRVLLASFRDARVRRMRRAFGPTVATALATREVARLWLAAYLGRGLRVPPGAVAAQVPVRYAGARVVDRRFVARAHRLGLQVHVWTVDAPDEMHELLDLGVDGIMTDHPEVLREVYLSLGVWRS